MEEQKQYISRIEELKTLRASLLYRDKLSKEYLIKLNLCWNNEEGYFLIGYSNKTLYI